MYQKYWYGLENIYNNLSWICLDLLLDNDNSFGTCSDMIRTKCYVWCFKMYISYFICGLWIFWIALFWVVSDFLSSCTTFVLCYFQRLCYCHFVCMFVILLCTMSAIKKKNKMKVFGVSGPLFTVRNKYIKHCSLQFHVVSSGDISRSVNDSDL